METAAEEYRDQIDNWKETVCAIDSGDSPPDEPEDEPADNPDRRNSSQPR